MPKKIMIVEDHEEMQFLYKAMFRRVPEIAIVAQEDTAEKALEEIPSLLPDLIIVDITLPGMSGLELTRSICGRYPWMKVLVVTAHDTDRYAEAAKEVGADNLVSKNSMPDIILKAKRLLGLEG